MRPRTPAKRSTAFTPPWPRRAHWAPDGSMHLLSAVANCPEVAGLTDHPAIRDDIAPMRASDWFGRLTPVQRQLLGGAEDFGGDNA
jgi:hypothetical protein